LPASFARDIKENPAFAYYFDHDGDKRAFYGEGLFMGCRYWDISGKAPRFPFGFGLSYTRFSYSDIDTGQREFFSLDEPLQFSIEIRNTGAYDGAEVVQVYVGDEVSSLSRPFKELKAFRKVLLQKGKSKRVEFTLEKSAFSFYQPSQDAWIAEPGEFTLYIGSSSADIRARKTITLR